jgi:predicted dehydrogenase
MKVCLIGICGHSKRAYEYLKKRSDIEFCGIAPESDVEGLDKTRYPELPFYSNYREMLEREKPDLALISPVFAHTGRVIIECAKRRIDVFSEKPIATSQKELCAVEAAVQENEIHFCAMHYLRYAPAFYHGARLVKDGRIGEVRMVTAQKSYQYGIRPTWYGDRALYGGTIPWVGIHAIDWIYHFTGKRFLSVHAQSCGKDPEMAAVCQFKMEDDLLCSVNIDYYRPNGAPTHGDDRIRCVGTKGVLEVRDGKIYIADDHSDKVITPDESPDLLGEFLTGKNPIPVEELFYLTRVAIAARDSADLQKTIEIGGSL